MSYNKFANGPIMTAGDMSADITSEEASTEFMDKVNFFFQWTGSSPTGSAIIQGTVDGTTWFDIGVTEPTISGNSGTAFLIVQSTSVCWSKMRVFWDRTSGTGSLNIRIHAKNI